MNVAPLVLSHVGQQAPGEVKGPEEVYIQHPAHLGHIGVGQVVASGGYSGVAHQDVHLAEGIDGFFHHRLHLLALPHVGLESEGLSPHLPHHRHRFLGGVLVPAVVDGDAGAGPGQLQSNSPAYAPATAGHDGRATFKLQMSPPWVLGFHTTTPWPLPHLSLSSGPGPCAPSPCTPSGARYRPLSLRLPGRERPPC